MAKATYTQVVQSLILAQGFNELPSNILDLDINRFNKEVSIIKAAYRTTLDDYFSGNKQTFDKAGEAWHNLGLVIDAELTINQMHRSEINSCGDW